MVFFFEDGRKLTEALVTGIAYDQEQEMYVLSVLGIDSDCISYTEPGKAWFDDDDFRDPWRVTSWNFLMILWGES